MKKIAVWLVLVILLCIQLTQACAGSFDDDGLLRLVNRDEKITKKYEPANMVKPDVPTNKKSQQEHIYMRQEAAEALEALFAAASEECGYTLLAVSGYRTFGEQSLLFQQKVDAVGSKEKAWRTVAPAGASEHQLGLAMDVVSENYRNLNRKFLETEEGQWLNDNCARFGYIIRYRKEWSDITGYAAEPWHIRYLGVNHALAVTALSIPYETYALYAHELPEYVLQNASDTLLYHLIHDMLQKKCDIFEALCNSKTETEEEEQAVLAYFEQYYLETAEEEE